MDNLLRITAALIGALLITLGSLGDSASAGWRSVTSLAAPGLTSVDISAAPGLVCADVPGGVLGLGPSARLSWNERPGATRYIVTVVNVRNGSTRSIERPVEPRTFPVNATILIDLLGGLLSGTSEKVTVTVRAQFGPWASPASAAQTVNVFIPLIPGVLGGTTCQTPS